MSAPVTSVRVDCPEWVRGLVDWERAYASDEERMRLAVELSRENVVRGTGGPFGAVVVEAETGRVVGAGVNSVVRLNNCTLHGEMVAFMMAQARRGTFTLGGPGVGAHELYTSCEPCAMCLGASLWSGVRRVVYAATRHDAAELHFDEGPVFPQSYAYLEARGMTFATDVLRDEARAVLQLYREKSGKIYNAR